MSTFEGRISRVEGAYEQGDARLAEINDRLNGIDHRFSEMNGDINSRFNEMNNQINSRFNNLYLLLGGSWVTLMATIIGLRFV